MDGGLVTCHDVRIPTDTHSGVYTVESLFHQHHSNREQFNAVAFEFKSLVEIPFPLKTHCSEQPLASVGSARLDNYFQGHS